MLAVILRLSIHGPIKKCLKTGSGPVEEHTYKHGIAERNMYAISEKICQKRSVFGLALVDEPSAAVAVEVIDASL